MNEHDWHLLEDRIPAESLCIADAVVRAGSRVRLHPKQGGDIFDMALAEKIAIVESIEQDYEGKFHVSVVIEDDPGKDMGLLRQPGHRFFFEPDEIEPTSQNEVPDTRDAHLPRILVAGIGNIFLGDDAFGVEVIARLIQRKFPANVTIKDFGIKGLDLAYALIDGPEFTILVDACQRGEVPGTVYVIAPDVESLDEQGASASAVDAHGMDPVNVLRLAKSMGGTLNRILLVGCEPATFGPEEGLVGLSDPVTAAVDPAAALLEAMVSRILAKDYSDFDLGSVPTTGETHVTTDVSKS